MLTIRDWTTIVPHTVEIAASNGTLTRTYYVGGIKKPWDDEAKRFLATQLPLVVRRDRARRRRAREVDLREEGRRRRVRRDRSARRRLRAPSLSRRARRHARGSMPTSVQPVLQRTGRIMTVGLRAATGARARRGARDARSSAAAIAYVAGDGDDEVGLRAARGADGADAKQQPPALDGDILAPVDGRT